LLTQLALTEIFRQARACVLKESFDRPARNDIPSPMTLGPTNEPSRVTRREAMKAAGKAIAGVAGLAAMSQLPGGGVSSAAQTPVQPTSSSPPGHGTNPTEKLRLATCQLPVSGNPAETAKYIRDFMHEAVEAGAHLLHTSEACLSGYAGIDFRSFEKYEAEQIGYHWASRFLTLKRFLASQTNARPALAV